MKQAVLRLYSLPLLTVIVACGVDQRPLTYEFHALDTAGASAHAGQSNGGDSGAASSAGDAGAPGGGDQSAAGGGGCPSCGGEAEADAGAPAQVAGAAGSSNVSGSGGAAPSGGAAGAAITAGSAGTAGAPVIFPCGDLNQDAVDDCQQTLVQNSRFDANVSGWDRENSTTQAWDASNASGKPDSGSIQISNTSPVVDAAGALTAGSHQCVTVTPRTNYDFAARVMLGAGQVGGQAGVTIWLFDDDACAGNLVTGATPLVGGVAGSWTTLKSTFWISGGVHSMYVRLVAIKPFTQAALSVFIDDVLVAKR